MRGLIFGVVLTAWFCMSGQSSAQMDDFSSTITISNGLPQIAEQLCKDDGGLFYFPDGLGCQVYGIGYWQPMWIDFSEYPSLQKLKSDASSSSNRCVLGAPLYGVQPLHITVTLDLLSGDLILSPGCSSEELASIAAPEGYQVGQWPVDCRVVERLWEQWQTIQKDPDWTEWYGADARPFLTFHFQLADLSEKQVYQDNVLAEEIAWEEAQAKAGEAETGMLTAMSGSGADGMMLMEGVDSGSCTNDGKLAIVSISQDTNGWTTLIAAPTCTNYIIGWYSSDELSTNTTWIPIAGGWAGDSTSTFTDTNSAGVDHRFYRAILNLPTAESDWDGDGISDFWEADHESNPFDPYDPLGFDNSPPSFTVIYPNNGSTIYP
jgi:hypothetical protein